MNASLDSETRNPFSLQALAPHGMSGWRRVQLSVEAAVIYAGLPALFYLGVIPIGFVVPALVLGSMVAWAVLWADPGFDRTRLWNPEGFRRRLPLVLKLFCGGAVLMALFLAALLEAGRAGWCEVPERVDWFSLPRRNFPLWTLVMVLYPVLSVYPQELIFRALFHHRYGPLFGTHRAALVVNAVAFGLAHAVFHNAVAVGLTLAGGALFSITYVRTKSLLAASVEHALYGCLLFTLGLGWYFAGHSGPTIEGVFPPSR